jgi:flagellar motor switch protein FliM
LIKIGEVPKFVGQPGKLNKKLAIQVLDTLEGGDDDHE